MVMDVLNRKKSLQDVYYELVQGRTVDTRRILW